MTHKNIQETNADDTGEGNVDFRGNMKICGSEDGPETETNDFPKKTPGGNVDFSGRTLVVQ